MNNERTTEYLLDSDGTTRDINFTPSDYSATGDFLKEFLALYPNGELDDQDGEPVELNVSVITDLFKNNEGHLFGRFRSDSALIKHIQLYLDWPENGKCEVELSFFPNDLASGFTLEKFIFQLNHWWALLGAKEVFVRYENASWQYYDPQGLGVFYHDSKA